MSAFAAPPRAVRPHGKRSRSWTAICCNQCKVRASRTSAEGCSKVPPPGTVRHNSGAVPLAGLVTQPTTHHLRALRRKVTPPYARRMGALRLGRTASSIWSSNSNRARLGRIGQQRNLRYSKALLQNIQQTRLVCCLLRVCAARLDHSVPLAAVWPFHLWDGRSVAKPWAQTLPPPDMPSICSSKYLLSTLYRAHDCARPARVPPAVPCR